ncbi:HEAT repeat domain-containing protein [Candidatus Micrarchaeota archaeon]|nr:HEAT repeat domain-containing protein [Candidatus Micrarchaeota archaeon]
MFEIRPDEKLLASLPGPMQKKIAKIYDNSNINTHYTQGENHDAQEKMIDVAMAAFNALHGYGNRQKEHRPALVALLKPFLTHPQKDFRIFAIEAMGKLGHQDAVDPLHEKLKNSKGRELSKVIDALGSLRDPSSKEILQKLLEAETNPRSRAKLERGLKKGG